uniref:Lysocardiolipin acyltransferase 1 n=2 Tax=Cacopsylla melanoneura TaxID=428564 RepID=A0A8D9A549_9HEMI
MSFVGLAKGIVYVLLWYLSVWCGFFFVCCPLVLVAIVHPKTFRSLMSIAFSMWEMYPVALMNVMFGTEIILSGDPIDSQDQALFIMNHKTRLDWNFLWGCMFHASRPSAHRLKMVLKSPIRHAPGPGWVMQIAGFLYIERNWDADQEAMTEQLDYFRDIQHPLQLLIFPEGTDLSQSNIEKSNKFADSHDLPHYSRVLHPKTTGFTFLAKRLAESDQMDAIYDITVAYLGNSFQSEMDAVYGRFPYQAHFHIKKYDASSLPVSDTEGMKSWLNKVWAEKEVRLHQFYNEGRFEGSSVGAVCKPQPLSNALCMALVFWTMLQVFLVYGLFFSSFIRWLVLLSSLLMIVLSFTSRGVQHLEVQWFRYFNSIRNAA